jgi:hypothetical protein
VRDLEATAMQRGALRHASHHVCRFARSADEISISEVMATGAKCNEAAIAIALRA